MFYSRISRAFKGGLFAFACALFLMFGAQTGFAISCVGDPTLVLGVDFNTGDSLVLDTGGTCTINVLSTDSSVSLNSLTINTGVTLTHTLSPAGGAHNELDFVVANDVTINGTIDVSNKGYRDGAGTQGYTDGNVNTSGVGSSYYCGGSHGGRGGRFTTWYTAESYDSISDPTKPGGGGAGNSGGGDGGGVVRLTSTGGTITVNGNILADGQDVSGGWNSGGAGGTVLLDANTEIIIQSGKIISAVGGDTSHASSSSAGGGGRIALIYPSGQLTDNGGTITAFGGDGLATGSDGSAGTVYHENGSVKNIYIDGQSRTQMYYATEMTSVYDETVNNVYLYDNARFWEKSDATAYSTTKVEVGTGAVYESDADVLFATVSSSGLYLNGGTAKFDGELTLTAFDTTSGLANASTLITNGDTYISSGSAIVGNDLTWDANSNTIKESAGTTLSNVTVKGGGTLTHSETPASNLYDHDLDLTLSGTFTLDATGILNVDERGYLYREATTYYYDEGQLKSSQNGATSYGDTEDFADGSSAYSGGSHGGRGGTTSDSYVVADSYDSIINPTKPGGGGGNTGSKDGGGVIRITANIITLNENVSAEGGVPTGAGSGAGAGGTIYLNASSSITLDTGKIISADGGDNNGSSSDGAGGGGRVALIYPSGQFTNNGTVTAYGGNGSGTYYDGSAGTVYMQNGSVKNLYIHANDMGSMKYATEISSVNDEVFTNIYLTNNGRLYLHSGADEFATTMLSVPTDTIFESDEGLPTSTGGGTYSIGSSSINLGGGTAKFDGDLQLASFDSDANGGTGTLVTNGTTYVDTGVVVIGSGLTWEANQVNTIMTQSGLAGGASTINVASTYNFPETDIDLIMGSDDDITCTGKASSTQFSGCTGVDAGHSQYEYIISNEPKEKSVGVDLDSLTVKSGGNLSHSGAVTNLYHILKMTVGTLTVDSGGDIDVSSKGYIGGNNIRSFYDGGRLRSYTNGGSGDGGTTPTTTSFPDGSSYYSGGSHGGRGGKFTSWTVGAAYDSVEYPTQPGGGGAGNSGGGDGGGVIDINATTMSISGNVKSNGTNESSGWSSAGAGGSVYMNASTSFSVGATGVVQANGGDDTNSSSSSAGGGGRVAILSSSISNSGSITAFGGNGLGTSNPDGAAGTVFLHDTDDTYGDLIISNCSACSDPEYHTTMLDPVPTPDQSSVDYNYGYVFKSLTTSQWGVLNIPSTIDVNGTGAADGDRDFFCNDCVNGGNGSVPTDNDASDGEVVYNVELFSGGQAADYVCVSTNAAPTVSINSIAQKTDGSGEVDISITLDDGDDDPLTAKVEYSVGVGCGGGSDPTLDTNDVTGTGSPSVDNSEAYQIRDVVVTGGANTITFDWLSATDIDTLEGTYCIVVTPNDGNGDGTPDTQTYSADNLDPTGLATLTADGRTTLSILLGWTDVTETNFDHYEVWYGLSQVDVQGKTGTAAEWDDGDDVDLGTITTTDTTVTGLSPNIGNYFKIWAVDTFGNEETVTDIQAYTDANTPGAPTVTASASDALNVVIDENSNPSTTEYAIKVGALYVQANGTLGASEVWQTYTTWGGAVGVDATGLTANTSYDVSVKARNGDSYETALSGTTAEYTLAGPVTDVSLIETATGMNLHWTDAGQAGLEIYLAKADGSVCDSTYDILEYDNASVNVTSPRSMGVGTDHCHRVRIGSYNDAGVLNTTEYAFSGDLVTSSTSSSSSGGSSGGSSTAFYSILSNVSRSEMIEIDIAEKEELEKAAEEEEQEKEEQEDKEVYEEEELKKPIFEFDEKYVKEPIRYFKPLELVYEKYDFEVYERKTPKFKLVSELEFKYMKLEPIVLEKSLKEYFEDEEVKKELFRDVVEDFADEFLEEDFAEELLEELREEEEMKKAEEEPGEGEEELDLKEATDEVLEEILGEDMEDIDLFEPELEVDDDAEEEEPVEEVVEEEKTVEEEKAELEEKAAEILEELTVEEIVTAGVSEVVEASVTSSVRAAIEVEDEVEVHTDEGVYVVDNVEDIVAIIEDLDEDELEKIDLDGDGMNDLWQMSHGIPMFNSDPDGDGIPTSVEVYCGWDALSADSLEDNLSQTKASNLKGNTFGNIPAIRACGKEGSKVDIVLFDVGEVFGDEKLESEEELTDKLVVGMRNADQQYAGSMIMDESNQGIMLPFEEIGDGKYIVMLTGEDGVEHLSTLSVEDDKVPAAAKMEIGSKGLKLGFVTENTLYLSERVVRHFSADSYINSFPGAAVPVITGQIADFESLTVVATWKSRTLSSTAFSDASDGTFELEIPDSLPPGAHDIVVYLYNENDDLMSSATVLQFMK
jgi:hypothetical protein